MAVVSLGDIAGLAFSDKLTQDKDMGIHDPASAKSQRARFALEQAMLLVRHLEDNADPDFRFVRTHASALLQLVDYIEDEELRR